MPEVVGSIWAGKQYFINTSLYQYLHLCFITAAIFYFSFAIVYLQSKESLYDDVFNFCSPVYIFVIFFKTA